MSETNGHAPPTAEHMPAPVALALEHVVSGRHGEMPDAVLIHVTCGVCGTEAEPVLADVHYPLMAMGAHHRQAHPERQPKRIQRPGVDF